MTLPGIMHTTHQVMHKISSMDGLLQPDSEFRSQTLVSWRIKTHVYYELTWLWSYYASHFYFMCNNKCVCLFYFIGTDIQTQCEQ